MAQLINAVTPLKEARAALSAAYELKFTRTVQKATDPVFQRIKSRIPETEWPFYAPLIFEINRQKRIKDAVILAHHYQLPQIVHGVADIVGDATRLALDLAKIPASTALVCGVHYIAETVKLLNGSKIVLLPDSRAGCSTASSMTAADVLAMRAQYPDAQVVAYVTSSAAVKAVSDICCTSTNAADIVNALDADTVIMVPDQFLAQSAAKRSDKKIVTWAGACEVHGVMTPTRMAELRSAFPEATFVAHHECPVEVQDGADFTGSDGAIIDWIKSEQPDQVVVVAEGSLADNLSAAVPGVKLIRGCGFCPHMKRINLENILWSLHTGTEEIEIHPLIAKNGERALRRMLDFARTGNLPALYPEIA